MSVAAANAAAKVRATRMQSSGTAFVAKHGAVQMNGTPIRHEQVDSTEYGFTPAASHPPLQGDTTEYGFTPAFAARTKRGSSGLQTQGAPLMFVLPEGATETDEIPDFVSASPPGPPRYDSNDSSLDPWSPDSQPERTRSSLSAGATLQRGSANFLMVAPSADGPNDAEIVAEQFVELSVDEAQAAMAQRDGSLRMGFAEGDIDIALASALPPVPAPVPRQRIGVSSHPSSNSPVPTPRPRHAAGGSPPPLTPLNAPLPPTPADTPEQPNVPEPISPAPTFTFVPPPAEFSEDAEA